MAQNYISRGEVITLTAQASHLSGTPYRISGFNGVALISVESGEQLSFRLDGIFEFAMVGVGIGDLIFIDRNNYLVSANSIEGGMAFITENDLPIFGRAVTATDGNGVFLCRLLQS